MISKKIFNKPIVLNNRTIRKKNVNIDKYFDESKKIIFNDIEKLFKKKNKITDNISCPCCNLNKKKIIYKISKFKYEKCLNCKTVYVSNPLKKNILIDKYKNSLVDKIYIKMMKTGYMKKYNELLFSKYMNLITKNLGYSSGNIIDIGCGPGVFLEFVKKNYPNFNLFGSEYIGYSKEIISKLIPKKNFFFQKDINKFSKKNFDIIFLWGVLEHVRDPFLFLNICKKLLKKKGIIVFLIPNFNSRARELLGVNTPTLNPLAHINFFSKNGIKIMNKKLNLRLSGPFLELPIIDLMYPLIDSVKKERKNIIKKQSSYYYVYFMEKK